jgi:hypothetical protein
MSVELGTARMGLDRFSKLCDRADLGVDATLLETVLVTECPADILMGDSELERITVLQ